MNLIKSCAGAAGILWSLYASAATYDLVDGITMSTQMRSSIGAEWRTDPIDNQLLGKLNVPGQQNLCPDGCLSFTGDPAPNERLVKAKGAFLGSNRDNGNMNYQQWDVVAADAKISADVGLAWENYTFKVGAYGFLDPINRSFDETHNDTHYQPRHTARPQSAANQLGRDWNLKEAYVSGSFQALDRPINLTVGYQHIRWGEANFVALNSISEINPPNQRALYQPGTTFDEVFRPVPGALLNFQLVDNLSVDLFYQFAWVPASTSPDGSLFNLLDIADGNYANLSLGQFSEDPNKQSRLPGLGALFSTTSLSASVPPANFGYPKNSGQGGIRLSYFSEALNSTDFGFYFLNYHSRLPYVSGIAGDESCARNSNNFIEVLIDCRGFKTFNPATGLDPLPVDTAKVFLDYPENIQMYGMSFNTTFGKWSLSGEYSIRPRMPLQVSAVDTFFATFQPSFPKKDIPLGLDADFLGSITSDLPGLIRDFSTAQQGQIRDSVSTLLRVLPTIAGPLLQGQELVLPSGRTAVPDYLEGYSHFQTQPHQTVHGYVRLPVDQVDLVVLRVFGKSENPFGADQLAVITEWGFTHIWGMPPRSKLQLEGGDSNDSHASPGEDGTGSGGVSPDKHQGLRFNPTQQTHGFASAFSTGYRIAARFEYDSLIPGIIVKPFLTFSHDVSGVAPQPIQNFQMGTIEYSINGEFAYGEHWATDLFYHGWTGGRTLDTHRDADFIGFNLSYTI